MENGTDKIREDFKYENRTKNSKEMSNNIKTGVPLLLYRR